MGAHSVHDTHHSVPGNDAGFLLHAVFGSLVQDEIVVLPVPGYLHYFGGDGGENGPVAHGQGVCMDSPQHFPGAQQFLHQGGVFPGQSLVFLGQREIILYGSGSSPDLGHEIMGAFGDPGALQRSIGRYQLQSGHFQTNENDHIQQRSKPVSPLAHGLSHEERVVLRVLKGDAGTACHGAEWVLGYVERDVHLL